MLSQAICTSTATCTLTLYITYSGTGLFKAAVDGIVLIDASNPTAYPVYQLYQVNFPGRGNLQTLSFQFRNDPSYYYVDDIRVSC